MPLREGQESITVTNCPLDNSRGEFNSWGGSCSTLLFCTLHSLYNWKLSEYNKIFFVAEGRHFKINYYSSMSQICFSSYAAHVLILSSQKNALLYHVKSTVLEHSRTTMTFSIAKLKSVNEFALRC